MGSYSGYTKSELKGMKNEAAGQKNKLNDLLGQLNNYSSGLDRAEKLVNEGSPDSGTFGKSLFNEVLTQEKFDDKKTDFMQADMLLHEGYSSGENSFDFFDDIIHEYDILIENMDACNEEFDRVLKAISDRKTKITSLTSKINSKIQTLSSKIDNIQYAIDHYDDNNN
jgi:hypothetical protein